IALVSVESIREPVSERHGQYQQKPQAKSDPDHLFLPHHPGTLVLGDGVELPAGQLRWEASKTRAWYDVRVTHLPFQRTFGNDNSNKYLWDGWFLSTPGLDDELLSLGLFPINDPDLLPHRVKKHRLMNFAKVDSQTGFTTNYCFDLN